MSVVYSAARLTVVTVDGCVRVFVGVVPGFHKSGLTVEDVGDKLAGIRDTSNFLVRSNAMEEFSLLMKVSAGRYRSSGCRPEGLNRPSGIEGLGTVGGRDHDGISRSMVINMVLASWIVAIGSIRNRAISKRVLAVPSMPCTRSYFW